MTKNAVSCADSRRIRGVARLAAGSAVDRARSCTCRCGYGLGVDFTEYDTRLAAYAVIVDDRERILLTWYNGRGRGEPGWTLPGGGVEYEETLEAAVVREVREETGYVVDLDRLLATDSFTDGDASRPRPFKSVRVIYTAHIAGGSLGTLEREGTTDRAAWIPLNDALHEDSRAEIVDVAINAWHRCIRTS